MHDESPKRRDKQNGEWAEMQFVADAMRYGFEVFKPIGDSTAADVILIWETRLITIQVKSTFTDANGRSKVEHRQRVVGEETIYRRRR
jgi:hypothetical protein